jgi:hypothetical protein
VAKATTTESAAVALPPWATDPTAWLLSRNWYRDPPHSDLFRKQGQSNKETTRINALGQTEILPARPHLPLAGALTEELHQLLADRLEEVDRA